MKIGCVRALLLAVVTLVALSPSLHAAPQSGPGPVLPPGETENPPTVTPPGSDLCPCNCPDPPVTPADIFFCGGGDLCAALAALEEGDLERWLEDHCFPADGDGDKCEECLPSKKERAKRHCECEAHEVVCDQNQDTVVNCADLKMFMEDVVHLPEMSARSAYKAGGAIRDFRSGEVAVLRSPSFTRRTLSP